MAIQAIGKCVKCESDVIPGKWECYPGQPHGLEPRRYYIGTGVDKIEDRAKQRVKFYYTSDIYTQDAQGNKVTQQALSAEFVRGTLETGDPQIILFLEGPYKRNLISVEEWERQFINEKDLLQMKQREFENRRKAAQEEENELLERIKRLKEEEAAALAKKERAEKK